MEFLGRVKNVCCSVELGLALGFCALQRLLAVRFKASEVWRLVDWYTVTEVSKVLYASILRANFGDTKGGGNRLLRMIGNYVPVGTASYLRRFRTS